MKTKFDPKDEVDKDDEYDNTFYYNSYGDEDEMDRNYPEYSKESRNAGRFLGVDFPYIPGDPDF